MLLRTGLFRQEAHSLRIQTKLAFSGIRKICSTSAAFQVGICNAMEPNNELFEYTSGRWLYNENKRLAERRLSFNVDALKKAAAKSVQKPESDVRDVQKLAEGGFNRIFEISMQDGMSVLARLPYPSTFPRHLAVASEVATMDFVRAHGISTPRVLGYAIEENPVGSDYILMEKLPGRPIGDAWFDMSEQQRLQFLYEIVKLESALFDIQLPASGSIYYCHDLDSTIPTVLIPGTDGQFCVGPYTGSRWWAGERANLELDRGPHTDALRVLQAPAEKELSWIHSCGQPRYPFHRQYREAFKYEKQSPNVHAKSLEEYLRLTPYLVPKSTELNIPVLRHPDLQPNNIFISEEDNKVTSLIDWQHAVVLPTFLAAGIPNSFQNYNDPESRTFSPPQSPEDFDALDEDGRTRVQEEYRHRHVHFFYLDFTQKFNLPHWRALSEDTDILRRRAFDHASEPWEGLNTSLQYDLVQISKNWNLVSHPAKDGTAIPCPISFTQEEAEQIEALQYSHHDVDGDVENINSFLGIGSDGWTTNELFESAKEKAAGIREEGLASADDDPWLREKSELHWPYDDYDEDE